MVKIVIPSGPNFKILCENKWFEAMYTVNATYMYGDWQATLRSDIS